MFYGDSGSFFWSAVVLPILIHLLRSSCCSDQLSPSTKTCQLVSIPIQASSFATSIKHFNAVLLDIHSFIRNPPDSRMLSVSSVCFRAYFAVPRELHGSSMYELALMAFAASGYNFWFSSAVLWIAIWANTLFTYVSGSHSYSKSRHHQYRCTRWSSSGIRMRWYELWKCRRRYERDVSADGSFSFKQYVSTFTKFDRPKISAAVTGSIASSLWCNDATPVLTALLLCNNRWRHWVHCTPFSVSVHWRLLLKFACLCSRPALFKHPKHTWPEVHPLVNVQRTKLRILTGQVFRIVALPVLTSFLVIFLGAKTICISTTRSSWHFLLVAFILVFIWTVIHIIRPLNADFPFQISRLYLSVTIIHLSFITDSIWGFFIVSVLLFIVSVLLPAPICTFETLSCTDFPLSRRADFLRVEYFCLRKFCKNVRHCLHISFSTLF